MISSAIPSLISPPPPPHHPPPSYERGRTGQAGAILPWPALCWGSSLTMVAMSFAAGNPLSSTASTPAASASWCCWTLSARKMHLAWGHLALARLTVIQTSPPARFESNNTSAGERSKTTLSAEETSSISRTASIWGIAVISACRPSRSGPGLATINADAEFLIISLHVLSGPVSHFSFPRFDAIITRFHPAHIGQQIDSGSNKKTAAGAILGASNDRAS
jgi:hypothetical protein